MVGFTFVLLKACMAEASSPHSIQPPQNNIFHRGLYTMYCERKYLEITRQKQLNLVYAPMTMV